MFAPPNFYFTLLTGAIGPNVRRYVQLAQSRGGACFCTRGAVKGYDGYYFILALAKTVTPGGSPPAVPGADRTASHKTILFSQKVLAVRKANCIYRPVSHSTFYKSFLYSCSSSYSSRIIVLFNTGSGFNSFLRGLPLM